MVYVLSHCLWPRPWSQTAEKLSLFLSTSIFHIPEWVHQKAIATFQLQVTSSITSILSFLVPFRLFYKLKLSFTLCEHTGLVSLLGFVWRQFCLTAYRFWYKKKNIFQDPFCYLQKYAFLSLWTSIYLFPVSFFSYRFPDPYNAIKPLYNQWTQDSRNYWNQRTLSAIDQDLIS